MIRNNVVYLTIAEKSYPRKLAFSYLDELAKEFESSYGAKVDSVRKPYAFVGFGEHHSCAYDPLIHCFVRTLNEISHAFRHIHVEDGTIVPGYTNSEHCELES